MRPRACRHGEVFRRGDLPDSERNDARSLGEQILPRRHIAGQNHRVSGLAFQGISVRIGPRPRRGRGSPLDRRTGQSRRRVRGSARIVSFPDKGTRSSRLLAKGTNFSPDARVRPRNGAPFGSPQYDGNGYALYLQSRRRPSFLPERPRFFPLRCPVQGRNRPVAPHPGRQGTEDEPPHMETI